MSEGPSPLVPDPERRTQFGRDLDDYVLPSLLVIVCVALAVLYPRMALYAGVTALLLTPCVLVHEWGHYRVAKKAGLGVEEFSVGFGKRVLSRVDEQGMRWSLKMVPLGGSVQVKGMTVEATEQDAVPRDKAYAYASVWVRLKVAYAGVVMNVLLAWGCVTAAILLMGPGEVGWRGVLLAPLAALVVLGSFVLLTLTALWSAVTRWDADVGSILIMPQALESGVGEATATGLPLGVYFAVILALMNLSLGVVNSLPLFPLDGYHGMVAAVDGLRNRKARRGARALPQPLTVAQMAKYSRATMILLGVFVISLLSRDILRLVTG